MGIRPGHSDHQRAVLPGRLHQGRRCPPEHGVCRSQLVTPVSWKLNFFFSKSCFCICSSRGKTRVMSSFLVFRTKLWIRFLGNKCMFLCFCPVIGRFCTCLPPDTRGTSDKHKNAGEGTSGFVCLLLHAYEWTGSDIKIGDVWSKMGTPIHYCVQYTVQAPQ